MSTLTLTRSAREYLAEQSKYAWNIPTVERVLELADQALKRPDDFHNWDEELYVSHTVVFATPDWSLTNEYVIDQANYRAALNSLSAINHGRDASPVTIGHWTYSRFQAIKLRVVTPKLRVTKAFVEFAILRSFIEDYPLLDESIHSDLETELLDEAIQFAINDAERDKDRVLSELERALFSEEIWNSWEGGEIYIDRDTQDRAWNVATGVIQRQETSLF